MCVINFAKDLIDIIVRFGPVITASGIWYVAYKQWKTNERMRRGQSREIGGRNYNNLIETKVLMLTGISDDRLTQLRAIRDEARLFLPQEISDFVQDFLNEAEEISGQFTNASTRVQREEASERLTNLILRDPLTIYRQALGVD